jgi:hypothetical protein
MMLGDIVQHRTTGEYGTVEYSTFGFSIHTWETYKGSPILAKSMGYPAKVIQKYWEVVDMPKGYEVHQFGGLRSKDGDTDGSLVLA